MTEINNFTVLESVYGRFIVNRHCSLQAESLIKTGRPHIQDELNNILAIAHHLPEGCVVVDAGANIGLVAVPIAGAVRPKGGAVIAFEVQRMMYYALCGTVALNDLENLVVHNKALGSSQGTLGLGKLDYGQPQDFGLFSLVDQAAIQADRIEVVTIDSLALSRLDFLKIDVEGMEIDVLKGASNTIHAFKPWCWVEYWKVDIADIKAQFAGLDYRFFVMDALNLLAAPREVLDARGVVINAQEV